MSDKTMLDGLALGEALRALPLPEPDASDWQRMRRSLLTDAEQQVQHRRRRRGHLLWAAAALLLIALLPRWLHSPQAPASAELAQQAVPADVPDLLQLQAESAQLDALLRQARSPGQQSAALAALSGEIIDRVQWIDASLGASNAPADEHALWQERVLLLRQLTHLGRREQWLAAAPANADQPLLLL